MYLLIICADSKTLWKSCTYFHRHAIGLTIFHLSFQCSKKITKWMSSSYNGIILGHIGYMKFCLEQKVVRSSTENEHILNTREKSIDGSRTKCSMRELRAMEEFLKLVTTNMNIYSIRNSSLTYVYSHLIFKHFRRKSIFWEFSIFTVLFLHSLFKI